MSRNLTNTQVLLNEYIKRELSENEQYSGRENDFFEFFSASQILKEYNLSDEEIENGICDGGYDGGCDSLYIFGDGNLIVDDSIDFSSFKNEAKIDFCIIQSKNTMSFNESTIETLKTALSNLFDMESSIDTFKDRYNEKIRSSFDLFKKIRIELVRKLPKVNIKIYYATKGNQVHQNVIKQKDELCELLKSILPNPSTTILFEFIDADKLWNLINKTINKIFIMKLSASPLTSDTDKVFIATVKLSEYYKFITNENGELIRYIFESNVRDYQGKVSVNQDIQETLEHQTNENFWWLNNGVTIIASDVRPETTKERIITNPEIVNGLQTSTEIFNYFSRFYENLSIDTREILIRIIVPNSEELRDRIIFATNNQTQIQKSSLRATDVIHRQIEMYFKTRNLFYDRRKNYYKNMGKKPNQIISLQFLAQCLMSVLLKMPNYARARPSTLLTNNEYYEKLYKADQNLDVYHKIATIGKKVDGLICSVGKYSRSQITDIRFYVVFSVFFKLIKKDNINSVNIVDININEANDDFIIRTCEEVYQCYLDNNGNDKLVKGSDFINILIKYLRENCLDYDTGVYYGNHDPSRLYKQGL
ncbi:hypothetical protein Holit_00105 [Hollandina sp. SP2]